MKRNYCKLLNSGVFFMLGASALLGGTIRYVPSPYGSIQAAYEACSPGDTVVVADGTYTGGNNANLWLYKDGTAASNIMIKAANVGGAVLDARNQPDTNVVSGTSLLNNVIYIGPHNGSSGSYNVVQGFEIKNGYHSGIFIDAGAGYNQILMNNIHNNG